MLKYTYCGKPLSLYNISKYMLGYQKLVPEVHGVWCDTLEREREKHQRILKLKPRGTYKTTIYTVAQVVELLMEDWIKNKGEFDKRVLIASATEELASQILGEIQAHFQLNENIKKFFEYDPIRSCKQQELWLAPKSIHKEPTVKAKGALGSIVSEHYDIILCDDIVNSEDRESRAKRERNWRWYQDVISILEPDGYLGVWGTRWHFNDVYDHIFKQNPQLPEEERYSIEVEGAIDESTGLTRFPSILTDRRLTALKIEKGLVEFYAQYLNMCVPTETQLFKLENMHFFPEYGPASEDQFKGYYRNIGYCDPALGKSEKGDYLVFGVGTLHNKRLYLRDVFMSNVTTPERAAVAIEKLVDLYSLPNIYLESNGFQSLYANYFKDRDISVIEYRNTKNKEVRIEGLEPYITSGRVLFREDWELAYPQFIEQMNMYPATEHDDAPDMLEGLTQIAFGKGFNMPQAGVVCGVSRNTSGSSWRRST